MMFFGYVKYTSLYLAFKMSNPNGSTVHTCHVDNYHWHIETYITCHYIFNEFVPT